MPRIKVLDEQLANQIAAGEVVERPASVVKELVENAIDAGGTTIDVAVEEGGLTLIRVTDNGGGIPPEDMATAFQRHATSKISSGSDLFRIASLGFRGEALPSIAAVSRLSCVSAETGSGLARRLFIEGGTMVTEEPANAPQGTEMSVRDLFYNTPARLKYMKSIQTELGHISDYMNRVALAHPGIAITLKHNGNTLLQTLGTGDRLQVIAAVYGTSTAKTMLPLSASDPDYELTGYVSKPELTRANRNGITVVVNGRYIRSFAANGALLQAYHTLLPINRFPLAVLEIGMHPSLLDVNVHPSKMEVRFSKETELKSLIEKAVKDALATQRHIPGPGAGGRKERVGPLYTQESISFHIADRNIGASSQEAGRPSVAEIGKNSTAYRNPGGGRVSSISPNGGTAKGGEYTGSTGAIPAAAARSEYVPKDAAERLYTPPSGRDNNAPEETSWTIRESDGEPTPVDAAPSAAPIDERNGEYVAAAMEAVSAAEFASADSASGITDSHHEEALFKQPSHAVTETEESVASTTEGEEADEKAAEFTPGFPELHWIGQHHGTYIVAQSDDGLYLIDQHAAHERINYEYYLRKFGNPVAASQSLLVPITLEFTPGEAAQLRELTGLLLEAGVEIEPFGAQTFLVRSYPEWMPQGEEQALLEEMAELVINERKSINIAKLREKAAIMCACKASIKANDRMTREEGDVLLARLARCAQPYTCPHGRPIIVHLSTYQLEKMFKRVMS